MSLPAWILALAAAGAVAALVVLALRRSSTGTSGDVELPEEWPLIQRSIFSAEERSLHRQLRAALPHHTILAKLPLVRFCQPMERNELAYWFKLLGPIHVSFVVCAENGRVLAALDIEKPSRPTAKRVAAIKQSVLEACRIRYVKCRSDQLPTAAELQLLVPQQGEMSRPLVPPYVQDLAQRRSTLAHAIRDPRGERETQWYESGYSQDSFFAPDSQRDTFSESPSSAAAMERPSPLDAGARRPMAGKLPGEGGLGDDLIGRR